MVAEFSWQLRRSVGRAGELLAAERACVVETARLIIECPGYDAKIVLGRALHRHALAARDWCERLAELGEPAPDPGPPRQGQPTSGGPAGHRLAVYRGPVLAPLIDGYRRCLADAHPVADEPSILLARRRLSELAAAAPDLDRAVETAGPLASACGHWAAETYVPPALPARDPAFDGTGPAIDPFDTGLGVRESAVQLMHLNLTDLEFTTMELCSLFILKGAGLPWAFTVDMARQVWDEARHAQLFHDRIRALGAGPGARPVSLTHWQISHDQPLPVALSCHQLIGEWSGVDGALYLGDHFRRRGDPETAALFDFVARDEITHVGFGNAWLDRMLGDRDAARAAAESRRAAAGKPADGPLTFPLNRWACERSGYPEHEIVRLERRYAEHGSKLARG